MKRLACTTETDQFFTNGEKYEVIREEKNDGDDCFIVIDDMGTEHLLTKEPDSEGLSYKTWFMLEDDTNADYGKKTAIKVGDVVTIQDEYEPYVHLLTGMDELTVYAVNPTHRTTGIGSGERLNNKSDGFTFINEDGNEVWVPQGWIDTIKECEAR